MWWCRDGNSAAPSLGSGRGGRHCGCWSLRKIESKRKRGCCQPRHGSKHCFSVITQWPQSTISCLTNTDRLVLEKLPIVATIICWLQRALRGIAPPLIQILLDCLQTQCEKRRCWQQDPVAGGAHHWQKHRCLSRVLEVISCFRSALERQLKVLPVPLLRDQKRNSLCPFACDFFFPFILLRACQLFLVCNNTSSDKCKGHALNCLQSHFIRLVRVFFKAP